VETQTQSRRGDRWAAEATVRTSNWWSVLGLVAVVAGYAGAALVGAAARGSIELGDETGLVLVGSVPALGVLGAALGLVGTRRPSPRWLGWLGWLDTALGALLAVASIALIVSLVLALRSFS
jgi:hypothetical protein